MRLVRMSTDDRVVEVGQPAHCVNGQPHAPRQVIVGHLPCLCVWPTRGHRSFTCRTCGAVAYRPGHDLSRMGGAPH